MNIFRKGYCKAFQFVLRSALPVLPYRKPMILNESKELVKLFQDQGMNSVMIITDKGVRGLGITEPLEAMLKSNGINCAVYDETVANPTDINVEDARNLYIREKCQALIGFGGGSSMDCAKAVGARLVKPNQSLAKMGGVLKVHKRLPLLVAIPTTAGTGSETTLAAVITDHETHHKYAITDFSLIPRVAVLDAEITRSLPPSITASTGMDALTHAVEAYIGNSTTRETRRDAMGAVGLIFKYLGRAYDNGDDMEARERMLEAAYLAGNAFSKSYVGYVHAVAHSLSGAYNVPHGVANAVLLPWVLDGYGSKIHSKLHDLAIAAGIADENDSDSFAAAAFIRAIREMNMRFQIPRALNEIQKEDIPELARIADKEANPLYPVPVLMDHRQLEGFYETVRAGALVPAGVKVRENAFVGQHVFDN